MAGVAGVVDRVLDEQLRTGRAVRVVAIRARHLRRVGQAGGGERMSGDAPHLRALRLVAPEADFGLRRLAQHLLIRRVDVVTVGARHATALVLTAGPVRSRQHLGLVAREARGAAVARDSKRAWTWLRTPRREPTKEP